MSHNRLEVIGHRQLLDEWSLCQAGQIFSEEYGKTRSTTRDRFVPRRG
ncbi:MAG: hypothetical protein H7039_11385 [Bryobacteraceae bacterium]|nr:hypothetical protein [Bryobacteraceae bacterium]